MATRIYFPAEPWLPAPINPPVGPGWEVDATSDQHARAVVGTKTDSNNGGYAWAGGLGPNDDVLVAQYVVHHPLVAQTIAGVVKGSIAVLAFNPARAQLLIKVVSSDGQTLRGTLLPMDTGPLSNPFPTTSPEKTRRFPKGWTGSGASLTPVDCLRGDFLVIEMGARHDSGAINLVDLWLGDNVAAGDCDEAEDSARASPWVEFSQTLLFVEGEGVLLAGERRTSVALAGERVTSLALAAERLTSLALSGESL